MFQGRRKMIICKIASSVSDMLTLRFSKLADRTNAACWRRNHVYSVVVNGPDDNKFTDSSVLVGGRMHSWNIGLECKNCERIFCAGLAGVPCIAPFFGMAEMVADTQAGSTPSINRTLISTGLSITLPPNEEGDRLVEFSEIGFYEWCVDPHSGIEDAINALDNVEREFERVLIRFSEVDVSAYVDAFKPERLPRNWWNRV